MNQALEDVNRLYREKLSNLEQENQALREENTSLKFDLSRRVWRRDLLVNAIKKSNWTPLKLSKEIEDLSRPTIANIINGEGGNYRTIEALSDFWDSEENKRQ